MQKQNPVFPVLRALPVAVAGTLAMAPAAMAEVASSVTNAIESTDAVTGQLNTVAGTLSTLAGVLIGVMLLIVGVKAGFKVFRKATGA